MNLVAAVSTRLRAEVTALITVEEAAELAALVASGALPQRTPAAFVVPLGFDDRGGEAVTGLYRQSIDDVVGIVIVVQVPGDPKAARALASIDTLKDAVINALAGWLPEGAIGALRILRGRLVSVANGVVIFQIDVATMQQLRIAR